jgi:antitoxin ParD1/3/4
LPTNGKNGILLVEDAPAMTTLNISLPDSMRTFIEQQVSQSGYSTASEYIRQLVRADQKRAAQERLEALLLEGIESGPPIEATPEYWAEKKARLLKEFEERKR